MSEWEEALGKMTSLKRLEYAGFSSLSWSISESVLDENSIMPFFLDKRGR